MRGTKWRKFYLFWLCLSVDNGYYFPYTKRYRGKRDSAIIIINKDGAGGESRRRKDPVLLLPWWKEILGTIILCIATTTYIVRKFFHPPAPVAYVRVRPQTQPARDPHTDSDCCWLFLGWHVMLMLDTVGNHFNQCGVLQTAYTYETTHGD